jgi:hypothetical protein
MTFRREWRVAAGDVGVTLPTYLLALDHPKRSHVQIAFRSERMKDWASTSLMVDGPFREEYIEKQHGLPPGSVRDVYERYVTLSVDPIPISEFHPRYPDVPSTRRYEFVLLHELGHVVKGDREAAADEYAFARMLLVESPEARAMRSLWYAKMPKPGALFSA